MLKMSHHKRPWDNIPTVTNPSGVARAKRRAVSRLSVHSILNDASDDDDSDQDITSVTVESTSTALSEVCSALSASSSPRKTTSPAFGQSGSVSGNVGEQWPSRRGICFGMVRSNKRFNFKL